ncbi:MAG: hypothetical protein HY686_08515 [Chloroflexi bacterium]|nr:hypothetical protein [Chloroflexota bacterium]
MRVIDIHVYVPRQPGLPEDPVRAAMRQYFRAPPSPTDPAEMAATYKALVPFREEVRPKILLGNAKRLLKL